MVNEPFSILANSDVGWLKNAVGKAITGHAILDFIEVLDERARYVEVAGYDVIANREPSSTLRAMTGVSILGKKFFTQVYRTPV